MSGTALAQANLLLVSREEETHLPLFALLISAKSPHDGFIPQKSAPWMKMASPATKFERPLMAKTLSLA